jgi:hypothetical protein
LVARGPAKKIWSRSPGLGFREQGLERRLQIVHPERLDWIMHRVWDFIWINVRKDRQREGIGCLLTEHRIMKVIAADGRVIQLMTKDAGFFERWFTVCRDYREEGWKLMTLQLRTVAL